MMMTNLRQDDYRQFVVLSARGTRRIVLSVEDITIDNGIFNFVLSSPVSDDFRVLTNWFASETWVTLCYGLQRYKGILSYLSTPVDVLSINTEHLLSDHEVVVMEKTSKQVSVEFKVIG